MHRITLKMSVMCGPCVVIRAYWITAQLGESWSLEYKAAAHGFDEQFKIPLCCQKLRRITRLLSGNGKAKVGINVKSGSRSRSVLNLPIEHKIRQQKDFKIIMDFVVNTEPVCGLEIRTADLDPNGPSPPSPLKISVLLIKVIR